MPIEAFSESTDGHATQITFDAVDQDLLDALELRHFESDLQGLPQERGGSAGGLTLVYFLPVVLWVIVGALLPSSYATGVFIGTIALVVLIALILSLTSMRRRSIEKRASIEQRFTLSISRDEFSCVGEKSPMKNYGVKDITTFEGGRRIGVVTGNGARRDLPFACGNIDRVALVQRLNELLALARADHTDYRGVRVAAADALESPEIRPDREDVLARR